MPDVAVYGSLPFREQIEFFRRKLNLPTESWTDIYLQEHDWAFVVAGANRDAIVADFRKAVDKAIAGGTTLEEFRRDFDGIVARYGWDYNGGRDWRSRVIYDTNLSTSYAAGRWEQLQDAPYWLYEHSDWVEHPREEHVGWDGMVLAKDDPWWQSHFPPNGWGCQCKVRGLWPRDLERMGKSGPDQAPPINLVRHVIGQHSPSGPREVFVPEGIDPGFEYAPGSSRQREAARVGMQAGRSTEPASRPWQATLGNTSERDWHDAAFSEAPPWLQDKVAQRGALRGGVLGDPREASLYRIDQDALNINPQLHGDMRSLAAQGLWRHEYGHAMDFTLLGDGTFPRSSEADFGMAMREDARDLIRALADRARLDAAEAQSAHALGLAADRQQWLQGRYAQLGLDFAQVQDAMRAHTEFAVTLQGAALEDRYRRLAVALELRDAEGLLGALTGGMGRTAMAERVTTFEKGNTGNLSDLFGSATRNKVAGIRSGFGHQPEYYDADPGIRPQAECFANLTSFYGDGNPAWARIVELMTPRLAALFKEIMQ